MTLLHLLPGRLVHLDDGLEDSLGLRMIAEGILESSTDGQSAERPILLIGIDSARVARSLAARASVNFPRFRHRDASSSSVSM